MRIVQLNLAADFALAEPEQLLDRYHTLTGWSQALSVAGADVCVVQRFGRDGTIVRDGVQYVFTKDGRGELLGPWAVSGPSLRAVAQLSPDVVHVNGLMFPGMTVALRAALGQSCAIVLQDHSGVMPSRASRPFTAHKWARAFRAADACTFTAAELAPRWYAAGLPRDVRVIEIPEASTTFEPLPREAARTRTGMAGEPAVLWVGRVDANKDPATVLAGMQLALPALPRASVWLVVPQQSSPDALAPQILASPILQQRARVVHGVPHAEMPWYYSAADVLISGSHHEGSGYAVIEAVACGVTPCVTDIPAFRALVDRCGVFWKKGDVAGCATALTQAARDVSPVQRQVVREHFDERLSWRAIGRQTRDAYAALVEGRRVRT